MCLKQPCIQVLHAAATLAHKPASRKDVVSALTDLLETLRSITATTPSALDAKLVEYAFVPVSQVLRLSRQVPVRALELCLECISALLTVGWGGRLDPALSGQLLILLTFLAKPSSADNGIAASSDELQALAFKSMSELLTETARTSKGKATTTATSNIPALGEAVLITLESLTDAKSNSVKIQAIAALKSTVLAISDDDALASFLPKMISSLTKVLTPSSSHRPAFRVLEQSLEVFSLLMMRLLSDKATEDLPSTISTMAEGMIAETQVVRSVSWLQATASQIKIALVNVFRLCNHDKSEVRWALLQLCFQIVQGCRRSLADCTIIVIETVVNIAGRGDNQDLIESELKMLLSSDHGVADLLRESLHGWAVSLPRVMKSKDEETRHRAIHQISITLRLFGGEVAFIDDGLAGGLRDGITAVLADSKGLEELPSYGLNQTNQITLLASWNSLVFPPMKLLLRGQEDVMMDFRLLLQELSKSASAAIVLQQLMSTSDVRDNETRLASLWAIVNLLGDMISFDSNFDEFIDMGTPNLRNEALDSLYVQSITTLTQTEATTRLPWQFYALSLEAISLQARRYKTNFRAELSEVLYPVLHLLGEPNEAVRLHALTCLNILATECGYSNAGELVIANVDYIINAIGLKLAVGDISPAAPQVLLMMMRLCGPSLLPYLDDLVESIFDALERYHGYSKLTELLFSVLKGMVEEGVKVSPLAITDRGDELESPQKSKAPTMVDVGEALRRFDEYARDTKEEVASDSIKSFPREPWKANTEPSEAKDDHANQQEPLSDTQSTESRPPAPKIYDLLLRISELTQHYLTTSSPMFRISLLSLLKITIPALARHENSFLPLINTLWPVLLPRLEDSEAYVVSSALDMLALMCEHAGNFMRSRIDHAWTIIRGVHRRSQLSTNRGTGTKTSQPVSKSLTSIETGLKSLSVQDRAEVTPFRPELYVDAPTRMIWNSLVALLCSIAGHINLRDSQFDQVLAMLHPVIDRNEVRRALESCNADAVWLQLYKKGKHIQALDILELRQGIAMHKLPVGRPQWQFVSV
ncbi:armadillo-type protein [Phaeosphaeria sp. MPI-PUGE-AT-0046c]|nr:armadillo-type protein [Phaeosphaeria sp. MPI-PUGE-AT-0046c]